MGIILSMLMPFSFSSLVPTPMSSMHKNKKVIPQQKFSYENFKIQLSTWLYSNCGEKSFECIDSEPKSPISFSFESSESLLFKSDWFNQEIKVKENIKNNNKMKIKRMKMILEKKEELRRESIDQFRIRWKQLKPKCIFSNFQSQNLTNFEDYCISEIMNAELRLFINEQNEKLGIKDRHFLQNNSYMNSQSSDLNSNDLRVAVPKIQLPIRNRPYNRFKQEAEDLKCRYTKNLQLDIPLDKAVSQYNKNEIEFQHQVYWVKTQI